MFCGLLYSTPRCLGVSGTMSVRVIICDEVIELLGRGPLGNSIERKQCIFIGVGGGVPLFSFLFIPDGISRVFHTVVMSC